MTRRWRAAEPMLHEPEGKPPLRLTIVNTTWREPMRGQKRSLGRRIADALWVAFDGLLIVVGAISCGALVVLALNLMFGV